MTSAATQALIKNARQIALILDPYAPGFVTALTDALEASEARADGLRDKVKALAGELRSEADKMCPEDDWPENGDMAAAPSSDALRYAARRLRALVEGPQGGQQ